MATLHKERARQPLAECYAVNGSQASIGGGEIGYKIDLYQRHPKHSYAVTFTREEMLYIVLSWIACEARSATDKVRAKARESLATPLSNGGIAGSAT